ncbi:MAG TPA: hypothetical protein PK817_04930, partial [Dokdonella sp.]|nr:hypothetical protein [Dokdonella sp.]
KLKDVTVLQSLDLYSCYGITDAGLAHLKGLTSLQWLYLNGCNKVTDVGRAALKKRVGDEFEVLTPGGAHIFLITQVSYEGSE